MGAAKEFGAKRLMWKTQPNGGRESDQRASKMEQVCENCKHWRRQKRMVPGPFDDKFDPMIVEGPMGVCKEGPPETTLWGSSRWPVTMRDDYCGHFEPNDKLRHSAPAEGSNNTRNI